MTVMTWGNSEGIKGRCDAKCHNALRVKCDCMCGGRYHGAGLVKGQLEKQLREDGDAILKAMEERAKAEGYQTSAPRKVLEMIGQAALPL